MKTYQKHNCTYFVGALVSILISTIFAVTLQFLKGDVLDYAIAGELETTVNSALVLILFILCEMLFHFFYARFAACFVVGCTKELKQDIFESILRRSYVSYRAHSQGEYIAKFTNEADTIKECRFRMLPMFWEIFFKIIFVSAALFLLDWRVALITLALLTTPLYIPKLIENRLQSAQSEQLAAIEKSLSSVNDWLSGFEIIKNFSVEQKILKRFDEANTNAMEKMLRNATLGAIAQLITTLISYLSYFIVLICSTWLVLKGNFSAGDFFIAIGMIDQLSYPLIMLANILRQLVSIHPACSSMEKFIQEGQPAKEGRVLSAVRDSIHYNHVSFAYPEQPPVLNDFTLTAKKGKRYLLKGPSGCGKTTAVNLLLRYYDTKDDSITVDGVPLSQYESTYGCMTIVRQEAVLFHDTLKNNLTMYSDIPDERLIAMLNCLGLEKFATQDGLNKVISENGSNLSGGEKKRICLARALLRDSDVLILDEPLANLDAPTAAKIEDLLLNIQGKLLLVVSHQFTPEKLQKFDAVISM